MSDAPKKELTPLQQHVTQEKGTERPFDNAYWDEHRDGMYRCVVCGEPLFDAATKFESKTGWPSFYAPVEKDNVGEASDNTHGMRRVEVHCNNCHAHLGHLFPDGYGTPTGLRYCINSASLDFKPGEHPDASTPENG